MYYKSGNFCNSFRRSPAMSDMKRFFIIFLAAFAFSLASAGSIATVDADDNDESTSLDDVQKSLEQGNAAFTGRFLYEALKSKPGENLIMSPYSIFTPLAQLALAGQGNTLNQLLKAMNLENKCDIRLIFPKLLSDQRAEKNVTLNVASKIYSSNQYPLSQDFLDETKAVFDSEPGILNLQNPQASSDEINKWVEDQTNSRIKDIANPDMITPDTRLILVNAIYFLGTWVRQFNDKLTKDRDFYVSNTKTVQVPTMYQQNSFKYGESNELDCKVLELNYAGGNFSFVVFLPNQIEGLSGLVDNLQDQVKFYNAYDSLRTEKVNVYLPTFKVESEFNLKDILRKLDVVDIFEPRKSNLTGILETYEPLYVSAAKQKAFCKVDSKGTEAAAANVGVVVGPPRPAPPPPPPKTFNADHPYSFYILNKRNVLFSGVFVTE